MRPARAVRHALIALKGEMGYPSALTAKTWGFYDVLFKGKPFALAAAVRQLRDGERAVQDLLPGRVPRADRGGSGDEAAPAGEGPASTTSSAIVIETQEPGVRIIDKTGPLANPADRDHCIQYMVAVPLIFGRLTARRLRGRGRRAIRASMRCARKMEVRENPTFTQDYYAADKRYIGNAVQVFFRDGTLHAARRRSTSRSATASAAPKACRCW